MDVISLAWRKSSYSGHHSGCVEVAVTAPRRTDGDAVMVRDSKDPRGPVLPLAPSQWQVLITEVRHGNYDTLG